MYAKHFIISSINYLYYCTVILQYNNSNNNLTPTITFSKFKIIHCTLVNTVSFSTMAPSVCLSVQTIQNLNFEFLLFFFLLQQTSSSPTVIVSTVDIIIFNIIISTVSTTRTTVPVSSFILLLHSIRHYFIQYPDIPYILPFFKN